MKVYLIIVITLCLLAPLSALVIVDNQGKSHDYPYETFFRIQGKEFQTTKELDGETITTTWKGIRFDHWLKEQKLGDFAKIKFISGDRYEMEYNKAEWDTLTCWLAYSQEDELFPKEQFRIIFPHLYSQHWVRDVKQVRLEDYQENPMPQKLTSMSIFFMGQKLITDPKPFVKMRGYRFDDFIGELSENPIKEILLYSADGLIQNLSYPSQLSGAVLELDGSGKYNLKSPQIPGGMWMKDIIYLQCEARALITMKYFSKLVPLAKTLDWPLGPETKLKLNFYQRSEIVDLSEALAEPMIFEGTEDFELLP
ncbi:MAG: hypothetical protein LHW64_05765 [Candidatus Cloacimonetes bacterium]|jgi:hypothetical protein|nr:hypothetical protein [Candidatus Cloacimonadota bacterium]MCB5287289.1 hypothetical protein [Candidatus Cloacimonadota bacterium]MCK9184575.1 hypothetical protein [Candidatus Cloacimonadota bacterium]MCK9585085.1 hypothetical protein [Candidatus Cloacimonadota bacterium]MDY0229611.1 hypothetical protein [Candidatus Cloacimonadaceae bacterium]